MVDSNHINICVTESERSDYNQLDFKANFKVNEIL